MANQDTPKVQEKTSEKLTPEKESMVPNFQKGAGQAKNPRMAGFLERLVAIIVDSILVGILAGVSSVVFTLPAAFFSSAGGSAGELVSGVFSLLGSLVSLLFGFLYFGYFFVYKGWTPGGMLMKIKLVRSDNMEHLTWGKVLIRMVVNAVGSIVFYLGYLWYFMSEKRQTWGDIAAGSYAVKADEEGNLLMDGPDKYKKEPVKTFLPCGCWFLFMAVLIGLFVAGIFAGLSQLSPADQAEIMKQMEQYEDYEYEYEDFPMENFDQEEFETMFEEELQRQLQESQMNVN